MIYPTPIIYHIAKHTIMKTYHLAIFFFATIAMTSCIKDDFLEDEVDPVLRISNPIDSLELDSEYLFHSVYLNNVGIEEDIEVTWSSTNPEVISVDDNGLATAQSLGQAIIITSTTVDNIELVDSLTISVGQTTVTTSAQVITGNIQTTTFYTLEGGFEYRETDSGVLLSIDENYRASSSLPGLYIYLSNNPNSIANAFEIGKVTVFSGAHEYNISDVGLSEYSHIVYFCKPFNVKVGDATL